VRAESTHPLGWRIVRFTWQQAMSEPDYVAATLRGLLALRNIHIRA